MKHVRWALLTVVIKPVPAARQIRLHEILLKLRRLNSCLTLRRRIRVCHMRRRIHVCDMRRRMHVCQASMVDSGVHRLHSNARAPVMRRERKTQKGQREAKMWQ